jgi:hypothetical protein
VSPNILLRKEGKFREILGSLDVRRANSASVHNSTVIGNILVAMRYEPPEFLIAVGKEPGPLPVL